MVQLCFDELCVAAAPEEERKLNAFVNGTQPLNEVIESAIPES